MQVLIAEDDPQVRELVLDVVKDLGHSPSCASNGADALAKYAQEGADVVVSDWLMPVMDGVQLCQGVRSHPKAPYTYFILLTALADAEHRLAGIHAGADDYLSKPFSLDDIEARLVAAERVTIVHRRREAALRLTRQFAAETDPEHLLDALLWQAIELLQATAGVVTRWDESQNLLLPVGASSAALKKLPIRLHEGASGRAAETRETVFARRARNVAGAGAMDPFLERADLESAIAVPLLHETRLVGTLAIGTNSPEDQPFSQQDAALLEMLATTAAAALVALEHARLDGVLLAARTAQHELNNQLAVARGFAEMLVGSPDLPPHLQELAEEVMNAADDAAGIVRELRNISHIQEQKWNEPADTTIKLADRKDRLLGTTRAFDGHRSGTHKAPKKKER